MKKDITFFADDNTKGVKLTSTSANHIANLAKEYIASITSQLENIEFCDVRIGLLSSDKPKLIQAGASEETINKVPSMLEDITEAKSLIAWLREALKAKDNLLKEVKDTDMDDWAAATGQELPPIPKYKKSITTDDAIAELSVKDRQRYFSLETKCAVIGKYIHPDGTFSKKREDYLKYLSHPYSTQGSGSDMVVSEFTPSVQKDVIENLFFNLQNTHREAQAELNGIKYTIEKKVQDSAIEAETLNADLRNDYNSKYQAVAAAYNLWVKTETQRAAALKIVIPNALMPIYNKIAKL